MIALPSTGPRDTRWIIMTTRRVDLIFEFHTNPPKLPMKSYWSRSNPVSWSPSLPITRESPARLPLTERGLACLRLDISGLIRFVFFAYRSVTPRGRALPRRDTPAVGVPHLFACCNAATSLSGRRPVVRSKEVDPGSGSTGRDSGQILRRSNFYGWTQPVE